MDYANKDDHASEANKKPCRLCSVVFPSEIRFAYDTLFNNKIHPLKARYFSRTLQNLIGVCFVVEKKVP